MWRKRLASAPPQPFLAPLDETPWHPARKQAPYRPRRKRVPDTPQEPLFTDEAKTAPG